MSLGLYWSVIFIVMKKVVAFVSCLLLAMSNFAWAVDPYGVRLDNDSEGGDGLLLVAGVIVSILGIISIIAYLRERKSGEEIDSSAKGIGCLILLLVAVTIFGLVKACG